MEMREHVRFSDAMGPVADRTAVKNRWKLPAEEAMAEVRLIRVNTVGCTEEDLLKFPLPN
jgi:hypothetical protein